MANRIVLLPATASRASRIGAPSVGWHHAGDIGYLVQLQTGAELSEAELVAFAKQRIGSVKAPKQVHVWPDLPRSAVGKILKTTIRQRLLRGEDVVRVVQP